MYDRDAWTDLWDGLAKVGVHLNPGDKQSLRLAAGPPAGVSLLLSKCICADMASAGAIITALHANMYLQAV